MWWVKNELALIFKGVFPPIKSSWKFLGAARCLFTNFILVFPFYLKSPLPPPHTWSIMALFIMHFWHVFPQPPWRSRGDYIRRGLRENKEDGGLWQSSGDFSRLQRVIQNYTEGYIISYNPWIWTITVDYNGGSLRSLLRTSKSNWELYRTILYNI